LGGSNPGGLIQSSKYDAAVSAWRAFLSKASRSVPGGNSAAFLLTSLAYRANRSRSDKNRLDRFRISSAKLVLSRERAHPTIAIPNLDREFSDEVLTLR
jgi:hypothetical protein